MWPIHGVYIPSADQWTKSQNFETLFGQVSKRTVTLRRWRSGNDYLKIIVSVRIGSLQTTCLYSSQRKSNTMESSIAVLVNLWRSIWRVAVAGVFFFLFVLWRGTIAWWEERLYDGWNDFVMEEMIVWQETIGAKLFHKWTFWTPLGRTTEWQMRIFITWIVEVKKTVFRLAQSKEWQPWNIGKLFYSFAAFY